MDFCIQYIGTLRWSCKCHILYCSGCAYPFSRETNRVCHRKTLRLLASIELPLTIAAAEENMPSTKQIVTLSLHLCLHPKNYPVIWEHSPNLLFCLTCSGSVIESRDRTEISAYKFTNGLIFWRSHGVAGVSALIDEIIEKPLKVQIKLYYYDKISIEFQPLKFNHLT